jgi:hypothetical protein
MCVQHIQITASVCFPASKGMSYILTCSRCGSWVPSTSPFVLKQLSKSVSVGRRSNRECSARRLEILFGKYFAIQRAALDTQKEQQPARRLPITYFAQRHQVTSNPLPLCLLSFMHSGEFYQ